MSGIRLDRLPDNQRIGWQDVFIARADLTPDPASGDGTPESKTVSIVLAADVVLMPDLPQSDPHVAGAVYVTSDNDLKVSAG